MARRYNPYYNQGFEPSIGEIGYAAPINFFDTERAAGFAEIGKNRQSQYDDTFAKYEQAISELSSADMPQADRDSLIKYLSDRVEKTRTNIADKYGNDYGQAKNMILGEVSKLRPIYAQAQRLAAEEAEQRKLAQNLKLQGKLIGDESVFSKQMFDPNTGKFSPRGYDFTMRSDYDKELQGTLTAINNTSKESGLFNVKGVDGILKSISQKGMAYFNDPKNRQEYDALVDMASKNLLKNSTWMKDNEYISKWGQDPITSARNYVDSYLKANALADTKIDYVNAPKKTGSGSGFKPSGFGLMPESKYEPRAQNASSYFQQAGVNDLPSLKTYAQAKGDKNMLNDISKFEKQVIENNPNYKKALNQSIQDRKIATNVINEFKKNDAVLSKLDTEELLNSKNPLAYLGLKTQEMLKNGEITKEDLASTKGNTSDKVVQAMKFLNESRNKNKEAMDEMNNEFSKWSMSSTRYGTKFGEESINKSAKAYFENVLPQLNVESKFRSGDNYNAKVDPQFGTMTEKAATQFGKELRNESNFAGIDIETGSKSKDASLIYMFNEPVSIDGEKVKEVRFDLPKEPERRQAMLEGIAIKTNTPMFVYKNWDNDLLQKANEDGDISVGDGIFVEKSDAGTYMVKDSNGNYIPQTYSNSPSESLDKFEFMNGRPSYYEKYLYSQINNESTPKDRKEMYMQELFSRGQVEEE